MTISFIGSATANGTSLTLPTHQTGDRILMAGYRNNATNTPSVPSGWAVHAFGSSNTNGLLIASKLAASDSEVSGTWANATQLICTVYRGSSGLIMVGGSIVAGGLVASGGNVPYTGLTVASTATNLQYVGVAGHRGIDTDIQVAPTGMTNRTSIVGGAAGELTWHDTNGNVASWSTTNYVLTTGASSGYRTCVLEIMETDYVPASGGGIPVVRGMHGGMR